MSIIWQGFHQQQGVRKASYNAFFSVQIRYVKSKTVMADIVGNT